MREFLTRLRFFFSRRPQDALDEELQFHLEQSIEANIAAGMTQEEARRQARIAFGGVERTREQTHEQHPRWLLGTVMQDIRYALRGFRRNPLFTVTVVATLALGIGATTAVFSVVDPILFRSLPYTHADRVVSVGLLGSVTLPRNAFMLGSFYFDWKDNQRPFEALTAQEYKPYRCELTQENPVQLACLEVEANYLPTLGVAPRLGRNFLPEEDRPHGPKVALISYRLWVSHFNRDPGILNKLIEIEGKPVRVIGVLPADFETPTLDAADVLVPIALDEAAERRSNHGYVMRVFARLKPGVSIAQAKSELKPLLESTRRIAPPYARKRISLSVCSMRDFQMQDVQLMAWVLLGAVFAVLLIACANVASLFMARGAARERELAMRFVLGASRGRLVRQTLTEAFLLAMAGAVAGCVLAEMLLRVFIAMAPTGILFLSKARLDLRIILFTLFLSLFCAALFGVVPALQRPRTTALAARSKLSGAPALLRRGLVVSQIAISILLLSGAMLLLRSFWGLQEQNLGMETRHVLTVSVSLSDRYRTGQKQMEFYQQAEPALRRLPGITAIGLSDSFPPGGWQNGSWSGQIVVAGESRSTDAAGSPIAWRWVTPNYFDVLDIPIVQGRNFTEEERNSNAHFMILSRLLASRLFPAENAIGQSIKPDKDGPWYVVVGVAGNVKNSGLASQNKPEYYRLRRNFAADWDPSSWGIHSVIILDSALPPAAVAPWVRSQIAHIEPTALVDIATLNQQVSKLAARPRFETALLGFFAFTGLLMAILGLYGVTAFVATQRTQEIGVRMALGASRFNILRLILWEGARLIALGGVVGLVAALAFSRVLRRLLFSISPYDPISFIAVALLLTFVALVATLVPARSAMNVDPVVALRHE
jgi:putative ABC transport system permease protein